MADTKVAALASLTGANSATGDIVVVVDVSDTTMAATGTDVKMTVAEFAQAIALSGRLIFNASATPATPATDTLSVFGRKVAGRMLPAFIGPSGLDSSLQLSLARNKVAMATPRGASATLDSNGLALTAVGTATAFTPATTNIYTWSRNVEHLVTVAATTAIAGYRPAALSYGTGNAAGLGGFYYVCRFGPATGVATTTNRCYVGMVATTTAPTDVEPSTLLNRLGCGWDAADTNIQILHNDASGTATKVDLGASFPVPTADRTKVYELAMFCAPNTTTINYEFTDIGTGAVATGNYSTDIPANTVLMGPTGWMSVGGTSSVIGLALISLYIETDQ